MHNNMPVVDESYGHALMFRDYGGFAPVEIVNPKPLNSRSQKTARKAWRRLASAPKAVRRRCGFKYRRGRRG